MKIKTTLFKKIFPVACLCAALYSCSTKEQKDLPKEPEAVSIKTTPPIFYSLVKTYPHDTTAFTEGFLFHEGKLFESTGAPEYLTQAKSSFGIVDLDKGKLNIKAEIDKKIYFGEGIVIFGNKIYQITLDNQVGFIYDAKTYQKTGQFGYQNKQGWGMTTDGKYIIMSDGTFNLTYFDPANLLVSKVLAVTENGYGLDRLNELEYIKGNIYANVWLTNTIVRINPATGEVTGKMDLSELGTKVKDKYPASLEMNGIAYDSINDKILVTGKFWPTIYEINFPH